MPLRQNWENKRYKKASPAGSILQRSFFTGRFNRDIFRGRKYVKYVRHGFAEGIADEEENQRSTNTDDDLVQVEEFYLQRHRGAVSQHAAGHGTNSAGAVGFFQNRPKISTQKKAVSRPPKANILIFQITLGGAMAIK